MKSVMQIMESVLELPRTDRSYLAKKLIESLDGERELSAEWITEIEERVARRKSGKTQALSREQVHSDIESILS